MRILAFETSAKACSVAYIEDGVLLAEAYENTGLTHSQTLMTMAQDMLRNCGATPRDVQAVAVAAGPGSFTGVRIGVAAAKGFAWGAELPCCGVSTLEAMARNLGVYEGYVLPVMDARRNQVYNALFKAEKGLYTRIREDRAISLEELKADIEGLDAPIFLVGDGSKLTDSVLQLPQLVLPPEHRMHQRAAGVALIAAEMLERGETCDAASLTPNYLRLSQAERERIEKSKGE